MHESLVALLDYGFGDLGLKRVEADIDPHNTHSAKSLERAGFIQEGLLRESCIVNGALTDSARYGLLRREWLARPKVAVTRKVDLASAVWTRFRPAAVAAVAGGGLESVLRTPPPEPVRSTGSPGSGCT